MIDIDKAVEQFYNGKVPKISDLHTVSESPEFGIATFRWKEGKKTVTIKAHFGSHISIVELK